MGKSGWDLTKLGIFKYLAKDSYFSQTLPFVYFKNVHYRAFENCYV